MSDNSSVLCICCSQWSDYYHYVPSWTHPILGTTSSESAICVWCRQTTTTEEVQALSTSAAFTIWRWGRREDSEGCPRESDISEQPALVLPWLYLGDFDDATNLETLKSRAISGVISLCVENHAADQVAVHRAAGLEFVPVDACDDRWGSFDIVADTWPTIRRQIAEMKKDGLTVMVSCWGGVNRAPAMVVAWLMAEEGFSFREAMHKVSHVRGKVLTNHMFRLQLLRLSRHLLLSKGMSCGSTDSK